VQPFRNCDTRTLRYFVMLLICKSAPAKAVAAGKLILVADLLIGSQPDSRQDRGQGSEYTAKCLLAEFYPRKVISVKTRLMSPITNA